VQDDVEHEEHVQAQLREHKDEEELQEYLLAHQQPREEPTHVEHLLHKENRENKGVEDEGILIHDKRDEQLEESKEDNRDVEGIGEWSESFHFEPYQDSD